MDAREYLKEKIRYFDSLRTEHKGEYNCNGVICGLCQFDKQEINTCISNTFESIDFIEKWSKEHPRKTMLSDLLEKLPNIPKDDYDLPYKLCPNNLGYEKEKYCRGRVVTPCDICWNRELPNE